MSLTTLEPLLADARQKGYAVGAFNVLNLETVRGIIKAAEELKSPVILQLAEIHLPYAPLEYLAPIMVTAARQASVPVAVHFDHGTAFAPIAAAIQHGFTSVMFDGASRPFVENIRLTKEIAQLGHAFGVSVEAELGQVGGAEAGNQEIDSHLTDVNEACEFIQATQVDALAVSIGNLHGQYRETPQLRFDRLAALRKRISIPLVLHGGSGISADDFRSCIAQGIHKINIGTALLLCSTRKVAQCCSHCKPTFFAVMNEIIQGTYEVAKEHMRIFMSDGQAGRRQQP